MRLMTPYEHDALMRRATNRMDFCETCGHRRSDPKPLGAEVQVERWKSVAVVLGCIALASMALACAAWGLG